MEAGQKRKYIIGLVLLPVFLMAQEVDTSSHSYQVGHQIGSWLPFLVIITLMVLVIIRASRRRQE